MRRPLRCSGGVFWLDWSHHSIQLQYTTNTYTVSIIYMLCQQCIWHMRGACAHQEYVSLVCKPVTSNDVKHVCGTEGVLLTVSYTVHLRINETISAP